MENAVGENLAEVPKKNKGGRPRKHPPPLVPKPPRQKRGVGRPKKRIIKGRPPTKPKVPKQKKIKILKKSSVPEKKLRSAIFSLLDNPPVISNCRTHCFSSISALVQRATNRMGQLYSDRQLMLEARHAVLNEDWGRLFRTMKIIFMRNYEANDGPKVKNSGWTQFVQYMVVGLLHCPKSSEDLLMSFFGDALLLSKQDEVAEVLKEMQTVHTLQLPLKSGKEHGLERPLKSKPVPLDTATMDLRNTMEIADVFLKSAAHRRLRNRSKK